MVTLKWRIWRLFKDGSLVEAFVEHAHYYRQRQRLVIDPSMFSRSEDEHIDIPRRLTSSPMESSQHLIGRPLRPSWETRSSIAVHSALRDHRKPCLSSWCSLDLCTQNGCTRCRRYLILCLSGWLEDQMHHLDAPRSTRFNIGKMKIRPLHEFHSGRGEFYQSTW